jgi:hypothetical protein
MAISKNRPKLLAHIPSFGKIIGNARVYVDQLRVAPEINNVRFHE